MLVESPERWMRRALDEAEAAAAAGEVPIGAVIIRDNQLLAVAHNGTESLKDASAHAELIALRRASQAVADWRLDGASLFVTLEPCTMCIGALVLARVSELYFGCYDPRQGACGSLYDLSHHAALPHQLAVFPELLAKESEALLKSFFSECRTTRFS